MIEIWFEGHAQTHHNAAGVASGHYDVALTEKGREHARSVRRQYYANDHFDVVFTLIRNAPLIQLVLSLPTVIFRLFKMHGYVNVTTETWKSAHALRWKQPVRRPSVNHFPTAKAMSKLLSECRTS